MVEFKEKADKIILERYGLKVERVCAMKQGQPLFFEPCEWADKLSYEDYFYTTPTRKTEYVGYRGFPIQRGSWCKKLKYGGWLKQEDIRGQILQADTQQHKDIRVSNVEGKLVYGTQDERNTGGCCADSVQILGIAVDEPKRIERHSKENILLPLVEIGWTEADCRKWCEENDLLSPTYTTSMRGGCWFCHNQGVQQLRLLRRDYPDLWAILMKWDLDSPVSFHPDGHSVHDFDKRFQLEDEGVLKENERFKWKDIDHPQLRIDWDV